MFHGCRLRARPPLNVPMSQQGSVTPIGGSGIMDTPATDSGASEKKETGKIERRYPVVGLQDRKRGLGTIGRMGAKETNINDVA